MAEENKWQPREDDQDEDEEEEIDEAVKRP